MDIENSPDQRNTRGVDKNPTTTAAAAAAEVDPASRVASGGLNGAAGKIDALGGTEFDRSASGTGAVAREFDYEGSAGTATLKNRLKVGRRGTSRPALGDVANVHVIAALTSRSAEAPAARAGLSSGPKSPPTANPGIAGPCPWSHTERRRR